MAPGKVVPTSGMFFTRTGRKLFIGTDERNHLFRPSLSSRPVILVTQYMKDPCPTRTASKGLVRTDWSKSNNLT